MPTTKKAAPKKPAPGMRLEQALTHLRRGKSIRRRSWHRDSRVVRLDRDVFVILPKAFGGGVPQKWSPYTNDLLASDWELVR